MSMMTRGVIMARSRSVHKFVSCLFEVVYLDGVPFIQGVHLRMLGTPNDIRIDDDSTAGDLSLMDCYDIVDKAMER